MLTTCGGVTHEAKVANFLRVLLAKFIEDNISNNAGGTLSTTMQCADGGEYTVTVALGSLDPSNITSTISTNVTFNNCNIKVCDDNITLRKGGGVLTLGPTLLADGTAGMESAFRSTDVELSGFESGKFEFAYKIRAKTSASSIGSIEFLDQDPPKPMTSGGVTYDANAVALLSEGC